MGHRKRPSLHILFKEFAKLDKIEIWANQRGEKIIPWSRQALIRQARDENYEEIMSAAARHTSLEAILLLREMAGPEATQRALEGVKKYKEEVKKNVGARFE